MKSVKNWKTAFYDGHLLKVHKEVYEPAEDSFLIADNLSFKAGEKILDMGTGCGILAIKAANMGCEVVAVDINPYATYCAKENIEACGLKERIYIIRGDLFNPLREKEYFDAIVFNPPYLPVEDNTSGEWLEKAWNGGPTGREVIRRFIDEAYNYLKHEGEIYIVQSPLSNVEETLRQFRKKGLTPKILDKIDLEFESLILINARKSEV